MFELGDAFMEMSFDLGYGDEFCVWAVEMSFRHLLGRCFFGLGCGY